MSDPAGRSRCARAARWLGAVGGVAGLVAVLAIGVFPTRTWLDQRARTADADRRLEVLREENDALAARIVDLESDAEIERIAREQFNLVLPGEEAYVVLPPPLPPVELPELWPFGSLVDAPQ